MRRAFSLLLLLVATVAFAQEGEPFPELKNMGGRSIQGPDGNASATGELKKPFCFKALGFCAAAGMKVTIWSQRGRLVALQALESPTPFTLFGVRFAARSQVELVPEALPVVRGQLEAPIEVDGRLVKGRVELQFSERKLLHAQAGTLAREAVIEGWKVPAGYSFELQNLASGSMVLKGPKGASPATWAADADAGIPTLGTAITQWVDDQGAKNLMLELPARERIGGVDFGPGSVTFLRTDLVRAVRGVASTAFERGAVKAPKGSTVVLCDGELQTVATEDASVHVGSFVTSKLDAVRERTPKGWRNNLYGQKIVAECSEGALLGYTFLPQYCPSCSGPGRVPSLVQVDLKGEPLDDASRAMLEAFPSGKKLSCPTCR